MKSMTLHKYLILLLFSLSGCVSYNKFDTSKASGAFELAKQMEEDKRFEEALMQYETVKNRFPYSPLAVSAELQIAEVYFKKEAFPEAQGAYQLFKELHPRHLKIDYVTYQIGESIYHQLPSSNDRDLSTAPLAIKQFETVIKNHPLSVFVEKAKKRRKEIHEKLARKELCIANFYFRTEAWRQALVRYEKYLREYPKHGKVSHALYNAGIAAKNLKNDSKKNNLFRKLIKDHPKSDEAVRAKRFF